METRQKNIEEVILGLGELLAQKNLSLESTNFTIKYLREEKEELEAKLEEATERICKLEAKLFDLTKKKGEGR